MATTAPPTEHHLRVADTPHAEHPAVVGAPRVQG